MYRYNRWISLGLATTGPLFSFLPFGYTVVGLPSTVLSKACKISKGKQVTFRMAEPDSDLSFLIGKSTIKKNVFRGTNCVPVYS